MPVELRIPRSGESITEVQIGKWRKAEGDPVHRDEGIVEIETDKATMELPAPVSGKLAHILKKDGEAAQVGDIIGVIEEGAVEPAVTTAVPPAASAQPSERMETRPPPETPQPESRAVSRPMEAPSRKPPAPAPSRPEPRLARDRARAGGKSEAAAAPLEVPAPLHAPAPPPSPAAPPPEEPAPPIEVKPRVMPAARRALADYGLKASDVEGTGPGGRVLKEDVERHVANLRARQELQPAGPAEPTAAPEQPPPEQRPDEIVPMTLLRRRIAERLVHAHQTAALLTTFNEIDMSAVLQLRQAYQQAFQERHGVKLGFMSFFVRASVLALQQIPQLNAEVRDKDIVYHKYYDIGVAVSTEKGLVVPVIRNADRLSFADIERAIEDLARRARENRLTIDELQGGTFTITNGGIFGSLLSTPILNPPQSGILGLHVIKDRPVVIAGQVVARPMMYVALTYDHRIVDGREAVTFLRSLKETVEEPARMLVGV